MEAEQEDCKRKSIKPKTAKGKNLLHSGKKKIANGHLRTKMKTVCVFTIWNHTTDLKQNKMGFNVLDAKGGPMTSVQKGNTLFFVYKNCNSDEDD